MNTSTFKVGDHTYTCNRISVFDQMHLASEFRNALLGIAQLKKARPASMSQETFEKGVQFLVTGGGALVAPEVLDRVMGRCLRTVQRQVPGGQWSSVIGVDGVLMHEDISLSQMIVLMYHVFEHNGLLDFFSDSPFNLGGQEEKGSGRRSRTEKAS